MKAWTFSIVSAVVTISYSLGCFFFFHQPFWGFTAICVGALVTAYPLYFERQRINLIEEAQVAQYLSENPPADRGSSIVQHKLVQIKTELDAIRSGVVTLTYSELATATELRMRESLSKKAETSYWAVHIVDSERSLGVWGRDFSEYPYLSTYVEIQRRILNSGGQVTRLFLFEPSWIKENLASCKQAVNRHDQLYAGTARPIMTLCGVTRRDIEAPKDDFSILDEKEVFLWLRASKEDSGAFLAGRYITASALGEGFRTQWHHLSANAYTTNAFFGLLDEGKI